MFRKLVFLAAFFFCVGVVSAQSVDEVIARYIKARGGLDKIRSVKTERITGTISFGSDAEGPFFLERKRPLKLHMEITLNGLTMIRVYDGKSAGWIYNPFDPMASNPQVQPMTAAELANIYDEADFDGPFVDYKEKGNQIEFVGKDEILGKPAYKLKLTNKTSDVSYFYFDAVEGILLKWEGMRKIQDKQVPWETFFHDFREVNGLRYPFLIESDAPGSEQTQRIISQNIEVNLPLDNGRFDQAPAKPASVAPPAAPVAPAKPN